jgi:arabinogalactan endo-1,4-beta-galactosidase
MRLGSLLASAAFLIQGAAALTYKGADISSAPMLQSAGTHYYTASGTQEGFEKVFAANGGTAARVRVWTSGTYTLSYALSFAKYIKAAGLKLVVDLHYSDTCELCTQEHVMRAADRSEGADPGHQAIPSGWPTTLSGLNTQIYKFYSSYLLRTLLICF